MMGVMGRRGESLKHDWYDMESAMSKDLDDDQSYEVHQITAEDIHVYQGALVDADDSTFEETTTEVYSQPATRNSYVVTNDHRTFCCCVSQQGWKHTMMSPISWKEHQVLSSKQHLQILHTCGLPKMARDGMP